MILYFNGDSNTAGTELNEPELNCFAGRLTNKLSASTYRNDSVAGASNDLILRSTVEYLKECKLSNSLPDFIVIGWSSSEREDWFIDGEYRSINTFNVNTDAIDRNDEWAYWDKFKAKNYTYMAEMLKYWNTKIYHFHKELEYLGIPHLFFNAIHNFNLFGLMGQEVYEYNWNNKFYKPYELNGAMVQTAQTSGFKEITPGWHHYDEEFHELWASTLYNYINEHRLV